VPDGNGDNSGMTAQSSDASPSKVSVAQISMGAGASPVRTLPSSFKFGQQTVVQPLASGFNLQKIEPIDGSKTTNPVKSQSMVAPSSVVLNPETGVA